MVQLTDKNLDEKFINLAINLAKKNFGNSANNPVVGCVIVIKNCIIATGITSSLGRPHAEIVALNKVLDKSILVDATIYVTLEPCCHFGKSPPCVDEIIKYKFKKVVICSIDPNPKVNGKSIDLLKKNGIEVVFGIKNFESQKINLDFFKSISQKTPFISIKVATTLDSKIASKNFDSKWISGEDSRKYAHLLRSQHQAILVGANTIIQDDPSLDCRIIGLESQSPIQIVVSNNIKFSFKEKFFTKNHLIKKFLICSSEYHQDKNLKKWLENPLNNVIFLPSQDNKIDIKMALSKLHEYEIKSILIEGGSNLITQFIKQKLVDKIIWCRSAKIIGNDAIPAIDKLDIENIAKSINGFRRTQFFEIEEDLVEIFSYDRDRDDEYKN